jgi:DNA-binding SARP family transcriptional activator
MRALESRNNKILPPILPEIVRRTRLLKFLQHKHHYSVSWITGPAGSGKTTLVADYLKSIRSDFIWYRLDDHDDDLSLFFSHLAQAAIHAAKARKKHLALNNTDLMRPLEISRRFFEDLGHRITAPFLLVFDNYHEIPPDSLFHAVLKEGLLRLPPLIHTFILSREDPPKHYSGLIANRQLRLIGNKDLAFTLDETEAVIRQETGKKWPKQFITELHEKTEGWATGLILIAKGLYALKTEPASLSDLPFDRIFDYFAAELFDRADPVVRDFLLRTALLPRITPEIAETITHHSKAESLLKSLFKYHYFLEQYETRPVVYQFHPLFHEFLQAQARKALSKKEIKSIQLQAAALFEAHGLSDEAVALYHRAREFEKIVEIILSQAKSLISQGRNKTVIEWLDLLPEKTIRQNPWLDYWRGAAYKFQSPLKAKKPFAKAFDRFRRSGETEGTLLSWSGVVESIGNEWNSWRELDYYLRWFDRNIDIDFKFPSPEIEAYFGAGALTLMLMRKPQHPDLEHWIERTLALSAESRDASLKVFVIAIAIMVLLYKEAPADKIESLKTDLQLLAAQNHSDLIACYRAYIEPLSFFWSDISVEAAKEIVVQTMRMTQKAGIHFLDEYVFGVGVICALITDDFKEAHRYLDLFKNSLDHLKRLEVYGLYCHMKTLYHLANQEMDQALAAGYETEKATLHSGFVLSRVFSKFGLAGVLILSEKYEEARHYLTLAQNQAKKLRSPILQYQAELLQAYLLLRQSRKKQGLRRLKQALSSGKRHHFIRLVWWWNREILTHICALALEYEIEPDFVRLMIRAYRLRPASISPAADAWFWPVEIETMGHFKLKIDGQYLPYRKKAKIVQLEMLKLLVALGPKPVSIEKVIAILWPDKNNEQAASAFSSTLNRLRVLLGSKDVIRVQEHKINLDPKCCNSDIRLFEHLIDQAGSPDTNTKNQNRFHLYEKAVTAYKGRFLENESEKSWILEKQEDLKNKYLSVVMVVGAWYERQYKPNQALDLYKQALAFEPAEESLYRRLMNVQIKLKQNAEAVKTYLRCKKALHSVLGASPSEEMEKMYQQSIHATPSRKKF